MLKPKGYKKFSNKENWNYKHNLEISKKYEDVIENRPPNGILRRGGVGQRPPHWSP